MSTTTTPGNFPPGKQYGFYFDQGRCHGCNTCMIACQQWNGLKIGAPGRWMRVYTWEEGAFPNVRLYALCAPCYHCENPVCVDAANGALYKEPKYGAVLIDPTKATTQGLDLRKANQVCPYGAILFDSDGVDATASKCTMCIDRLEQGMAPICVTSCDTRALEFGPLDDLQKKFGTLRQLKGMPDPSVAVPAAIFKPQLPRKQIVPYDASKALDLWQQRGQMTYTGSQFSPDAPLVFQNKADVTDPQTDRVFKNKLVMHHKTNAELLYYTQPDE
jgi:anaerobic dimethyl sulfoxide reductase subunit B